MNSRQRVSRRNRRRIHGLESAPLRRHRTRDAGRVPLLLVVRESGRYDRALMLAMIQQTLVPVRSEPGVEEALQAALAPLDNPKAFDAELVTYSGTKAVLFWIGGTGFLYSMGSAAKGLADLGGDNAFAHLLANVVTEFRPKVVRTATFSRLVRAQEFGGKLLAAFAGNVGTVICNECVIHPATQTGRMLWSTLAMVSEMERNAIRHRLTVGWVLRLSRGELPWGRAGAPVGYRMRDDRVIEVDDSPHVLRGVPEVLGLLADPCVTYEQIRQRAGELGLSTPVLQRMYGDEATYEQHSSAGSMVETWFSWLDMYRTGSATILLKNTFEDLDELAGVPVVDVPDDPNGDFPHGAFAFEVDWGLPPGGWAEDHVFDAIERRLAMSDRRPAARGGSSHVMCRPLAGLPSWHAGDRHYRMFSEDNAYAVVSQPCDGDCADGWWNPYGEGSRHEVRVRPGALHPSLGEVIVKALAEGVALERYENRQVYRSPAGEWVVGPVEEGTAARAQRELDRARAEYESSRARARKYDGDDPDFAEDLYQDARDLKRRIAELTRELRDTPPNAAVPAPDRIPADVTQLVTTMAHLVDTEHKADGLLNRALRSVLDELRIEASPDGLTARWSVGVRVRTEGGMAVFGRVTGQVPNVMEDWLPGQQEALALRVLREWRTAEQITDATGWVNWADRAIDCLMELGVRNRRSASHLVRTPLQVLRDTVAALLAGDPLPAGVTDGWVRLIEKTYLGDGPPWSAVAFVRDRSRGQAAVDIVRAAGGSIPLGEFRARLLAADVLTRPAELDEAAQGARVVREAWRGRNNVKSAFPAVVLLDGPEADDASVVRLRPCPHPGCGGALTRCLHLPETPDTILCETCRRAPSDEHVVFPDEYLTVDIAAAPNWRRPGRPHVTVDEIRRAIPDSEFTPQDLVAASGAHLSTVRKVIREDVAAGLLVPAGDRPTATRGQPHSLYQRADRAAQPAVQRRTPVLRAQVREAIPDVPFTRRDLQLATGSSKCTAATVVAEELAAGRIIEAGLVMHHGGGPHRVMSFRRAADPGDRDAPTSPVRHRKPLTRRP